MTFLIKKKILVMTVQMDELACSRSLQHVCRGPNMTFISVRFSSTPVKLVTHETSHSESHMLADFLIHEISYLTPGSFMFFLVKRDFNKLNVPLK